MEAPTASSRGRCRTSCRCPTARGSSSWSSSRRRTRTAAPSPSVRSTTSPASPPPTAGSSASASSCSAPGRLSSASGSSRSPGSRRQRASRRQHAFCVAGRRGMGALLRRRPRVALAGCGRRLLHLPVRGRLSTSHAVTRNRDASRRDLAEALARVRRCRSLLRGMALELRRSRHRDASGNAHGCHRRDGLDCNPSREQSASGRGRRSGAGSESRSGSRCACCCRKRRGARGTRALQSLEERQREWDR